MSAYNRQKDRGLHTGSARWRAIRAQVLAEQPLCPLCEQMGRVEPAVDVDHVNEDSHDNRRENLRGLCKGHHSAKTFAAANGREFKLKGCDASGWPFHREGE